MTRYRRLHGQRGIAAYQVWNEGNVPVLLDRHARRARPADPDRVARSASEVDPGATLRGAVVRGRCCRASALARRRTSRSGSRHARLRTTTTPTRSASTRKVTYGARTGGPEDAMRCSRQARRALAGGGVPARHAGLGDRGQLRVDGSQAASRPSRATAGRQRDPDLLAAAPPRGTEPDVWYRYDWSAAACLRRAVGPWATPCSLPRASDWSRPAGRASRPAQRWLPAAASWAGTADAALPPATAGAPTRCVVRYAGGVAHRSYWNPEPTVRGPGAATRRGAAHHHGSRDSAERHGGPRASRPPVRAADALNPGRVVDGVRGVR